MIEKRVGCLLLSCMVILSQASKKITLNKVQCSVKSNLVAKVNCTIENNNALNILVTTNNIELNSLIGLSNLHLFIYGRNNVMPLNGIGLDICKMLDNSPRKAMMLKMFYKAIMQTNNNLPNKCPFKTNTTYALRNMKFDGSFLPSYVPEYNYSYTGIFHANQINSFEVRVTGSYCDKSCY